MTRSQTAGSTSEAGDIIIPKKGSVNNPEADSAVVASNHENAFVAGALPVSDDGLNSSAVSQVSDPSNSLFSPIERSSLEALELASSLAHTASPENQEAVSTALPKSTDGGSRQESLKSSDHGTGQATGQNLQLVPSLKTYASTIKTLSSHLPHLKNVQEQGLRKNVNVTCYDFADDALPSVTAFQQNGGDSELLTTKDMSLGQYLEDTPPDNVQLRLIVASDLSTALIECLGTSLSMSPEVYEEHLLNSGWRNGTYDDNHPDTWVTRDMKKSHMSIRWYRPVKRTLQQPYSASERENFLTSGTQPFSWTEPVPDEHGKPHGVKHQLRPRFNILRRDWQMNTNADAAISVGSFTAWEERATIWSKQYCNLRVVVLLLDPLPIAEDEMCGAAEALQRLGLYQIEPTATRQEANRGGAEERAQGSSAKDRLLRRLPNLSTFFRSWRKGDQSFSIRSIGKLLIGKPQPPQTSSSDGRQPTQETEPFRSTEDPESGQPGTKRQKKNRGWSRPSNRSEMPEWLDRLSGPSEKKRDQESRSEALFIPEEKEGTQIKTLEPIDRCMFKGLYPRGPVVDYDTLMDPENVGLLAEYLDCTKATAATFHKCLTHSNVWRSPRDGPASYMVYLFEIVHNDTMNTLRHMEFSLREISQHTLDNSLIQQRLVHWRHLLERFGTELQHLEETLRRFSVFTSAFGYSHPVAAESPERDTSPIEKLLENSVSQIKFVRQLTTRSHKSLMANMSIIESKRGIAEAESVTKLTELAFFFIPLTFSASIFSMQVKELNASRISIAAFFVLAIIITTASYALRLVIRSQKVIRGQQELLKNIRHDRGLAVGAPIPTGVFIACISRWVWGRFGILTIIVTFEVALLVTPTAVIWTRELNYAFKILLTVLLLTFILVASFVTAKAMLYVDHRGLRVRPWLLSRSFLIGFAATAVAAGPSAALWTSQLTPGIKVGVTIVLGILYVCTIVYLGLRSIQHKKPSVPTEDETTEDETTVDETTEDEILRRR